MKSNNPKVVAWSKRIVRQVKTRAKKQQCPFNITPQHLLSLWTGHCPVFKFPLRLSGRQAFDAPSLDKLVPSLGYTVGNVVILSMKANAIKSDARAGELHKVAEWLETFWSDNNEDNVF